MKRLFLLATLALLAAQLGAQTLNLPAPQKTGGLPLLDALARRSTSRAFATRDIAPQELSNLLWAAFGVNRPDGKRTAPSARNYQETDIYVLLKQGVFLFAPKQHRLDPISTEDVRSLGGQQPFVKDAPVTLVFVANLAKMGTASIDEKRVVANIDTGYISENVYLYCASAGFATGARAMVDHAALGPKLKLTENQLIVLAQSVGYPAP